MKKAYIQLSIALLLSAYSAYGMQNNNETKQTKALEAINTQLEENKLNSLDWRKEGLIFTAIAPDSLDKASRFLLKRSIEEMHATSEKYLIETGLATLFNEIPATVAGINTLVSDTQALEWANIYNQFLRTQSPYSVLKTTFQPLANAGYPEAPIVALTLRKAAIQFCAYEKIKKTSGISMPKDGSGVVFIGDNDIINRAILEANEALDVHKNRNQVRGALLMYAYNMYS